MPLPPGYLAGIGTPAGVGLGIGQSADVQAMLAQRQAAANAQSLSPQNTVQQNNAIASQQQGLGALGQGQQFNPSAPGYGQNPGAGNQWYKNYTGGWSAGPTGMSQADQQALMQKPAAPLTGPATQIPASQGGTSLKPQGQMGVQQMLAAPGMQAPTAGQQPQATANQNALLQQLMGIGRGTF
jgi:hypothetical protein